VAANTDTLLRLLVQHDLIYGGAVWCHIGCICDPNPANENAGDVLLIGLGEGGHEIIASGG
jgi:hypothetical protein